MAKTKDELLEAVGLSRDEVQAGIDAWRVGHPDQEISADEITGIVKDKLGRDHLRKLAVAIAASFGAKAKDEAPAFS